MAPAESPALQLALDAGLVTPAQLAAAQARLARAGGAAGASRELVAELARGGILDAGRFARLLAARAAVPVAELPAAAVAPDARAALPRAWAEHFAAIPLAREGPVLRVALSDPFDFAAIDGLGQLTGLAIEPAVAPAPEIPAAIARAYGDGSEAARAAEPAPGPEAAAGAAERESDADDAAPVIDLVDAIVRQAVARRASDIHFEPLARRLRVRYRIDGVLQEAEDPPWRWRRAVVSRLKIMANLSIAETRRPQDGRARVVAGDRHLDLRISSVPTVHGESVVVRVLEGDRLRPGLAELGLGADDRRDLERVLALPDGLVLVTGPTGSGKTTTLYACLRELNRPDRKIITVEDPVEYRLPGINQVPVHGPVGMTFAAALRAMLRQAPNVILVGEIRDRETAAIAINAALTGHLVLSSLHTNDAAGAVTRLIDIGVAPYLVASALRAVLAQRLVRRLCPHCARPEEPGAGADPGAGDRSLLGAVGDGSLWRAVGCPACEGSGYRGRVGIFELLTVDGAMQRLIHDRASAVDLRAQALGRGRRSLREDGLRQARTGLTSRAEVLAATVDDAKGM